MEYTTQKEPFRLSVVMPVYNEADIIGEVITAHAEQVCARFAEAELIIVDDCSTDATARIVRDYQQRYPFLRMVTNAHNSGHGASLLRGLAEARGDYILQNDSDNQFYAEDFWILFRHMRMENLALVIGRRIVRDDHFHRKVVSFLERLFILFTFGVLLQDSNSPFRVYTKAACDTILQRIAPQRPFFPSILMAICARRIGMAVAEVGVRHRTRQTGKTFIHGLKIVRLCVRATREIVQLWLVCKKERSRV